MSRTLREMIGIQLIYSGVIELAGLAFARDPGALTLGLWSGTALGIFMAVHIYRGLDAILEMDEASAQRCSKKRFAVRFLAMIALLTVIWRVKPESAVWVFAGALGLKAAGYLTPALDRLLVRTRRAERGE